MIDQIIAYKKREVKNRKSDWPVRRLEASELFDTSPVSLRQQIISAGETGVIAEFKRKSPSKGVINANALLEQVTRGYINAGASALSVLTDEKFFGGNNNDLIKARKLNKCPILRKDFIIDEYQIIEAKSIGADTVLFIASILTVKQIRQFSAIAKSLGVEILMEIHRKEELDKIQNDIDIIGVNNRDLKDMSVNVHISFKLAEQIPSQFVKISESGIHSPEIIKSLKKSGYQGFLIGEYFMQSEDPAKKCYEFISVLKNN